jgi:hypothetical protein
MQKKMSSLGEIARRFNRPLHRVEYVVRTRNIEPLIAAGGRNFYSEASAQRIESELRRIDLQKDGGDQ